MNNQTKEFYIKLYRNIFIKYITLDIGIEFNERHVLGSIYFDNDIDFPIYLSILNKITIDNKTFDRIFLSINSNKYEIRCDNNNTPRNKKLKRILSIIKERNELFTFTTCMSY